jgi:hypothetical protein
MIGPACIERGRIATPAAQGCGGSRGRRLALVTSGQTGTAALSAEGETQVGE